MTAESPESPESNAEHPAQGGGEDLRARYLPVSRRELRRRREAELSEQRTAQEQADDAADHLAAGSPEPQVFPAPPLREGSPAAEEEEEAEEEAPVPASRRSRRLLRETGRLSALTDERLAEIDEITRQAASVSAEDPNKVDPELLKKQQALAAKAMQENQERRRRQQEQEEAEREQRRRYRRQRPESEVITRKALRAYAEADDEDYSDVPTGEIDPVEARGAHGLELDEMVVQTSRQAWRQSLLFWLVIVLAVVLLVTLGIVLYVVL